MKKIQILLIIILISLSICAFGSMQAKAAASIFLTPSNGVVGDSVTISGSGFAPNSQLTATFAGSPLTLNGPAIKTTGLGAIQAGVTFTVPASATGGQVVVVTDLSSNSGSATFTVTTPLTVTVTPTSWTMDVGQTKVFSATPNGGSGTYNSYQWYVGGISQSGSTASTFSYSPGSAGLYSISATVTDNSGKTSAQSSPAASVNVAASPAVSITPVGPLTMDTGQAQVFTASPSGGSGAIHYQWYLDGGAVGSNSASYSYIAAGTSHSVTCKVTDSASTPVTSLASNAVSITVSVSPTVSIAPVGPLLMDTGQAQVFTATPSDGSGAIHYQWYLDGGAVGSNSASYSYIAAGTSHSVTCKVTDSASTPVTSGASNTVSVTVHTAQIVSVTPTTVSMDAGQNQIFTCLASGGIGTLSYQWYLADSAIIGQTSTTYIYSPSSPDSPTIYCQVTDTASTPYVVQSNTPSVTVYPALVAPTASASPTSVDLSQAVHLTSTTVTGGSGGFTYAWQISSGGAYSPIANGTTANYDFVTTGTGSFTFKLVVSDSAGAQVTSGVTSSVVVNSALVAPTVSVSAGTINQGQTSSLSAVVTTGTSPYLYQWVGKTPGASSYSPISGATSSSYSFVTSGSTVTGVWSFELILNDSVSAMITSNPVSVTVNAATLDHFAFNGITTQIAGTPFSVTITAKDALNNTLTKYTGTNTLNVSTGTITPTITGVFSNGVWTGSVNVTSAGSGIWLFTAGSGMSGTSSSFTVNSGVLDHFTINNLSSQTVGSAFSITVTAEDVYENTVTSYVGTPTLTCSSGSINPATMNAFVSGIGSNSVIVGNAGSGVTITVTDGSHSGTSNSFAATTTSISTPTPASTSPASATPTPISSLKPTPSNSSSSSSPKATPSPTSSPSNNNSTPTPTEVPLSFSDVSIFLAFLAIILLPTSKLIPRYYHMVTPLIRKLEVAAIVVSVLFLLTVALQVAMAIFNF